MSIPPRARIIAECCSNHGGNRKCIQRMIAAALGAGADFVKFQFYSGLKLSPHDPQLEWLKHAQLSGSDINDILTWASEKVMFSVFGWQELEFLRRHGMKQFKVGHADRWRRLWDGAPEDESWFVSYAWGVGYQGERHFTPLATIPLYPAPLEALVALRRDEEFGYSDHTVGLDACRIMLARGAPVIEKHFSIEGCPRRQPWDTDEHGLAELVAWAKICAVAREGTTLTERWGR